MIERHSLEAMDREALLAEAHRHGVKRAEVMTRVELTDEILRLCTPNPVERKEVRGWLGVARDMVASIVDKGLNLPDAAAVIRGDARFEPLRRPHAPVATVTLAEIYGAQGHYTRAIAMLDEVLDQEPDHHVARRLRDRLELVSAHKAPPFSQEVPAGEGLDVAAAVAAAQALAGGDTPEETDPFFADDADGDDDDDADDDGTLSTIPPPDAGPVTDDEATIAVTPPEEPAAPTAESPDEDGTALTVPPLEPRQAAQLDGAESDGRDEDGTAVTLPPLSQPPEPSATNGARASDGGFFALPNEDEDGTALTIPPSDAAVTAPSDTSAETPADEDAPKTLAPERLAPQEELPTFSNLEPPVRRVAPSDIDWEPLPQTELAPKIAAAPPDADAVIVLRTGDSTASLYFELASAPSDEAVLRVVELRPRRTFAERVERELPVTSKGGLVTIEELERGSIVRAAIGVREGDLFRALAVAAEVRAAAGGPEIVWAPRKEADYGVVAQNAALVLPQLRA